jgi:hypothetical protein
MPRRSAAWASGLFAVAALAASAFAQERPPHGVVAPPPIVQRSPIPAPTLRPAPIMTIAPIALPSAILRHRYVRAVPAGTKVPLWRLPKLPIETPFNTIHPGNGRHGGRFRPFAATGATIQITAAASCTTGGTVGDLFNVGCQLTVQAQNLDSWSSSDTYQDYVVPPNSVAATAVCSTYVGNADPGCTNANTQLSQQGTYQFLVYDTTQQVFAATIFVNAGQVFDIGVYQDPFHTQQAYQFDTSSSPAAYIYLTNVAPSDHYVVYVESTGVNTYCAYLTPAGSVNGATPRPKGAPGQLLCNPSSANVTGVQAPGGSLSLTWEFTSSLEDGSYAVVVYDQDANGGTGQTLGQVQVSLTGFGEAPILTKGSATGANNPSPGPNNANPPSESILAWDSSSDQSVGGITGSIQETIPGSTYEWTISNPEGRVMATSAPVTVPAPQGTPPAQTFAFSSLTIPPGQYPSATWVMQFYDTINKKVEASQAFQLLGYHATTQFIEGGNPAVEIEFNATNPDNVTADLKITNDSNIVYNGQGDSFGQGTNPAIEFTTGGYPTLNETFTPPTAGEAGCGSTYEACGTTFTLPSCSGAYNSAGGCSQTVQDSNGNNWTATEWCSTATPANPSTNDLCVLQLTPQNSNTVLPANSAYIDIANMHWYADGGNPNWPCYYTPCYAVTSVLPEHGLSWSYTNDLANPVAWTPVEFGSDIGLPLSGTTHFDYVGARPTPPALVAQGATPWTNAHYWQSFFTRGAYQRSTPYAGTRSNVASFLITNTSTRGRGDSNPIVGASNPGLAIGLPPYFAPSQVTVDPSSSAAWSKVACPSSFGVQYVCLNGPSINGGGGTATVMLDFPLPVSSFTFQEMSVQAWSEDQLSFFSLTNDGTTENTIDGCTDCSGEPTSGVDSLGIAGYSLNSTLISAAFTPSTVGSGQTPTALTLTVQNATTAADPNPDAIDAIVVVSSPPPSGEALSDYAVSGTPTMTRQDGASWNWLGRVAASSPANTYEYWFGVCPSGTANWGTLAGGPPQPAGLSTPLSSQYTALATCGATEHNSLWNDSTHSSATINLSLAGPLSNGPHTFYVYAHGANGGGWSAVKALALNVANESGTAGFQAVGPTCPGTTVATNALPTITTTSNCFVYTITNTSKAGTNIGTVDITLPAFDINGLSANAWSLVGSPITQNIKVGTISGGTFTTSGAPAGCTVNAANTSNPSPGVSNGKIEISGCTGFSPGATLAVEFQANSPSAENATYSFPSVLDPTGANQKTSPSWIGDQEVQTQFTVGLSVVVAPLSNPGPGYSTPAQNCSQCAFSGDTINFGQISSGGSVTATDVARATVVYSGSCTSSCSSWQLEVSATGDSQGIGELQTSLDEANGSTSSNDGGAVITYPAGVGAFFAMPTTPAQIASGPEQQLSKTCNGSNGLWCYDTIQNYKVSVGADTSAHVITVTYTLIAN